MRCVSCDQPISTLTEPCPHCDYQGAPLLVEELLHVNWLLDQLAHLTSVDLDSRRFLSKMYAQRQRELEIELGLRLPPFTDEQARQAWPDVLHHQALLQRMGVWRALELVKPAIAQAMVDETTEQVDEWLDRLQGRTPPRYPQTDVERLALANFLLQAVDQLIQQNGLVSPGAEAQVRSPLLTEKEKLEIRLGLRAMPAPAPAPVPEPVRAEAAPTSAQAPVAPAAPPSLPPPSAPGVPLTDRLWRTLLSERTLQAMLFMGIFLLFAAAISFVVWGWRDFSALVRVAIPTIFMLIFLGLGWYVRNKTRMVRSGLALTAIAALLIPIDFYTLYVNFHVPAEYGPAFWLATSLSCLVAYVWITLRTRAAFFGYLVGTAAGSAVLALIAIGHQSFDLSYDWRTAALSALAVGLVLIATALRREQAGEWRVMAEPFRNLALITAGVVMLLSLGWRYIERSTFDTLHYAMTINWWLGGFIFGWGAIHYRSRSLGLLAAISLPVATYMAQAAWFDLKGYNPAWHALGLALLVPLYFATGHRLLARKDDKVLYGHGRTATGWGVALVIVAALWSLTDLTSGTAAAVSHAVLCGAMVLAAVLWQRPRILYGVSLFSLTATTFAMSQLNFEFAQFCIGWASLSIAHVVLAFRVGRSDKSREPFAGTLVMAGYVIAALAFVPTLFPYEGPWLAYALGNWLLLCVWGAKLERAGQPGFALSERKQADPVFHWMAALALPVWITVLFDNRGLLGFDLALALAALAWGMVALSYRLTRIDREYRLPWYLVGLLASVFAIVAAFILAPNGYTPSICLLVVGLLYLADAFTNRQAWELAPGGAVSALGMMLLLDKLRASFDALTFALALLVAVYFLIGLWHERRRLPDLTHRFFVPLYLTSHVLALVVLARVYIQPLNELAFDTEWTDTMRVWEAASQLVLCIVYVLYAWATYQELWAYIAAWLGAAGVGFVAIIYSTGKGSLAARGALGVIGYILAERGLNWLRNRRATSRRWRAIARLIWCLFRRPLLVTGWVASVGIIGLALVRNLILLGGGHVQQIWAVIGLLMITALYALSARLFRRTVFVWLASLLVFAPWTILTNLGWFFWAKPTTSGFAISWVILAWALYLIGLALERFDARAYAAPAKIVAHVLLPFSLLWGIANVDTSRVTMALAIGYYALAAWVEHGRLKDEPAPPASAWRTRFLYPALGLVPIWCVYLLAWLAPQARHEHYGLMLLGFGPLGLVAGQWLNRVAPRQELSDAYALPAYLTGYVSVIVGTLLVAHDRPLLALVLLYDGLLMLISARVFRHPLWVYPAAALVPLALVLACNEASVPGNRQGWWLIGLAAIYLLMAWALRRTRLSEYGTATLTMGLALIAFGLPPSSQDRIGAFWGYGSAAALYALTASWLKQPLLLTPACATALMPYVVILREYVRPEYHGLALFPGAIAALALAWWFDAGAVGATLAVAPPGQPASRGLPLRRDFPWGKPAEWAVALADRLLNWYALPVYVLGFGMAAVSPFFANFRSELAALNWLLLMPIFGWAIYRFRLRAWLLATAAAGHLAVIYLLHYLGWWDYPAYAWLRFLPVTLITAVLALWIERERGEGAPLDLDRAWEGWSRPLYLLLLLDIVAAQTLSLSSTDAGALVTLVHALLVAVLASFWTSRWMPYLTAGLGVIALLQWLSTLTGPIEGLPVALAYLDLSYGLIGYGLALLHERGGQALPAWLAIWEKPLQRFSTWYSFAILLIAAWLGLDVFRWTARAILGFPFRSIVEQSMAWMWVGVLGLLGLLYVTVAFNSRRLRLGYLAVGMLLMAWMIFAFYIGQWDGSTKVQLYAIPAGLYLLGVGYLEARRGNKTLARWLDYAAVLLMVGSLFWQTLLFGWSYALMLGGEGFAAFFWGSARRLRRFLYAGTMGVILATTAQLINSLRSINQWIVFGLIGLLVVLAAIVIERKLEDIKAWRQILETWE